MVPAMVFDSLHIFDSCFNFKETHENMLEVHFWLITKSLKKYTEYLEISSILQKLEFNKRTNELNL